MEEIIYSEIRKNIVEVSNGSSDIEHRCPTGNFCIIALIRHFDRAYRDLFDKTRQPNLEPLFSGLMYCHFRNQGMSHENSLKESNVADLNNEIGKIGTYLRTFQKLWNEFIEGVKKLSLGKSASNPIIIEDSDDSDYNESDMEDTTGGVRI